MIVQELRKIFAVKRLFMILILGILFYLLFFQKNVGIPAYNSDRIQLDVSGELKGAYGKELDKKEFQELSHTAADPEKSEIDRWIQSNPEFQELGIKSYRDLLARQDFLSDAVGGSLTSQISARFTEGEQQDALNRIWKDDYLAELMQAYDMEVSSGRPSSYDSEQLKQKQTRMEERNQEEVYSLMPDRVMRNYLSILPDFAIFLILSVVLLVVPYSVKDTMEKVHLLQYGSKNGCNFYWKKGAAVLISAALLCFAEFGLLAVMLNRNGAFPFLDCFVSGFGNPFLSFMKLTFGQYIGLSLAYVMLMGLSLAMITYCLSNCAHNYISAIALQIPVVIFGIVVSLIFLPHFAEITQNIALLFFILLSFALAAAIGNVVRFLSIQYYDQMD